MAARSSRCCVDLGAQVVHVDRAAGGGLDDDDLEPGHDGRCGVGAVRAGRDEADPTVALAARLVVGVDGEQARELALRAGVGLERHGVVAGDLAQPAGEVVDEGADALGLVGRRERVQVGELRPGDRLHLGGGVELHRARAERDHAAVEREVAVGEAAQVAQHRRLGVVRVEDRVREELGRARSSPAGMPVAPSRSTRPLALVGACTPKASRTASTVAGGGRLVEAERDAVGVDAAQS